MASKVPAKKHALPIVQHPGAGKNDANASFHLVWIGILMRLASTGSKGILVVRAGVSWKGGGRPGVVVEREMEKAKAPWVMSLGSAPNQTVQKEYFIKGNTRCVSAGYE